MEFGARPRARRIYGATLFLAERDCDVQCRLLLEELFPAMVEVMVETTACFFGGQMYRVSGFTFSENTECHADADAILYGLSQLMLRRPPSSTAR